MRRDELPGQASHPRQRDRDGAVGFRVAAFVASAYPFSLVVGANMGFVPIPAASVLSSLAVGFGFTGILLLGTRFAIRDASARAAWSFVFLLIFSTYHLVINVGVSVGLRLSPDQTGVALAYTVAAAVGATLLTAPSRARRRDAGPALIIALLLVGIMAGTGVRRGLTADDSWHLPARAMIASALPPVPSVALHSTRDIFYIVLDGFGRADTLRDMYGADIEPFVAFLKKKGFEVPGAARSNYAQTYLSLAATLNLNYLDDVAAAIGIDGMDRRALAYLIDRNALMALARRSGLRVVGVGSDYMATGRLEAADVCICHRYGLNNFEQTFPFTTPLAALPFSSWAHDAHRRKVLSSFDAIEGLASPSQRLFVFAHVIAPHPPFVFMPDGTPRQVHRLFTLKDGSYYPGSREEYIEGYRDQTRFVTRRLTALVETLLSRPGPQPVIVLHGDHGPGSMLDWNDAAKTNMAERMGIFTAYYFPESSVHLGEAVTPINLARSLATLYLGVDLPHLPNRSYFSEWNTPYDFLLVSD